ncbi:MAG: DUF1015 domain-containing protein [Oscillospiraceae bacterium]|nr:DUF1015 domain-containing protein [Oscillospiraceae bacterium]
MKNEMNRDVFTTADILIPKVSSPEKWSVIACDQFSSQKDYWKRVENFVADAPSTLKLIIPEAYLEEINEAEQISKIRSAMQGYLSGDTLRKLEDSFIYVQRTQSDGRVREGIVGALDLEEYDFTGKSAAVRASEGTVLDRLPARIRIRKAALMELPHIITFINDEKNTVLGSLASKKDTLPVVYDFSLMEGGGHITGRQVTGEDAKKVKNAIRDLESGSDILMIMGDGNHSLAAAKVYWDELKQELTAAQRENHPARRALVEVNNVYDRAISFEAIHRVLFDTDAKSYIEAFSSAAPRGTDYVISWAAKDGGGEIGIKAACIGDMLSLMQDFMDDYVAKNGGVIDYIHGEDSARKLAQNERCLGLILPAMDKSEFFETVALRGVFPRKSFSVGHARDKRYYFECREI